MDRIQPVILCGGAGTRLWPISRKALPKQFAQLINNKSLLQDTFERVAEIADNQPIWTVANEEYRFLIRSIAQMAKVSCTSILEPVGRNTAAAMCATALNAKKDQLLLFLPADHYIPDFNLFSKTVRQAASVAKNGKFVIFGVTPTNPNTEYGYIQAQKSENPIKSVRAFIEKPNQEMALSCIASGDYYWNAGILLVQADSLLEALSTYAPDILEATREAVDKQKVDGDFIYLDADAFASCPAQSLDCAVLERHPNIAMIPFQGTWSDVGSWDAVSKFIKADDQGNRISGNGKAYNARSTYIHAPHRLVVAVGTEDLFIVDTSDAVLIANKEHVDQVKQVVAELEQQNIPQATNHLRVVRPWGEYVIIDEGHCFKVKRITVNPHASLSLQLHNHRAEHWIVVRGTARVSCDNKTFLLSENQSTFIPIGSKHRLENPNAFLLEMIEVQSGIYLGEDDIERFDDHYGRA